jgi:LmbE family N-acetylglucosaminyl deacetylase
MWPPARHIYLSPHLDDVVLSCGGMIFKQAQAGETVAVITLFAGSPPKGHRLSAFARSFHERWQASSPPDTDFSDPPAVRREEDRRAFATLSPEIQVVHLDIPDCIYRTDPKNDRAIYDSEEALFGPIHPDDPAISALKSAPPLPPQATIYVPLGVGGHVDHRVVCSAASGWELPISRVRYYADYPYAARPGAIEAVIGDVSGWEMVFIPLDEDALSAKIKAISQHASQISTFWVDADKMAEDARRYADFIAAKAGSTQGGEALWLRV